MKILGKSTYKYHNLDLLVTFVRKLKVKKVEGEILNLIVSRQNGLLGKT